MNKARRKTYKRGGIKRLINESFLLSCTRFLSSRVVRFFESGFASPLLTSVKKVDSFISEKITGPLFQKIELRKNFTMPLCNAIAALFSRNVVARKISSLRTAFLNLTLRTLGIFLFVFSFYTAGTFAIKRYISTSLSLGVANADAVTFAAITFVVGLILMLFGDKSILSSLSTGRITGSLLDSYLGVNSSSLTKTIQKGTKTAVVGAVVLGTLFGALTLFYHPAQILGWIGCAVIMLTVFHIPEFGLLTVAATLTFLPESWLAVLSVATLISFLLKCIRLKRNFHMGSADVAVLILFLIFYFTYRRNGLDISEKGLLAFMSLYFSMRNLVCSERLLKQTFNAFCGGLRIGMVLYILGEFSMYIYHDNLRMAANWLTANVLSTDMLVVMSAITLPFAFTRLSAGSRSSKYTTVFLVLACAVVVDSFILYAVVLVSFFVYVAMAYKAPVGSLLGGAIVLIPAFYVISHAVTFTHVDTTATANSLSLAAFNIDHNFWQTFSGVNGIITVAILVVAIALIFQRVLGCMALNRQNDVSLYCGTVMASGIMLVASFFMFNFYADFRIYATVWLILGLCGSVYQTCFQPYNLMEE